MHASSSARGEERRGASTRLLVVGGGYAGALAAVRAARRGRPSLEVTLVSESDALVQRIRLHESAATGSSPDWNLRPALERAGVNFVLGSVDEIDMGARVAMVRGQRVAFDLLVLALGTRVDSEAIPGSREHALVLEPGTRIAVQEAASGAARRGGRLVVVGGGLTGIELATELAERHPALRVALVTAGQIGERMCAGATEHVRSTLARLRIEVHEAERVMEIASRLVRTSARTIPFDVCVASPGFVAPEALRNWGLNVDEHGRACTDDTLRCEGLSGVWAVGDCAAPPRGAAIPGGCKTAMPMGAHAADEVIASLHGAAPRPFEWLDSLWCTSLGRSDGVIQLVRADGVPMPLFLRGGAAARVKEAICRMTIRSIELEAAGWLRYRWRQPLIAMGRPKLLTEKSTAAGGDA
jgi:NADH dehydrogenase